MTRFFLLWFVVQGAFAAELRPFDAKSPAAIERAHAGRPYVMVMWSLYCDPCRHETRLWGELKRKHPGVGFVLVSTDGEGERAKVAEFLGRHDLRGVQTWMFADEFSERVRYAVDPAWRGELPRTYVFDAAHKRQAYSGTLDPKALEAWLAQAHQAHPAKSASAAETPFGRAGDPKKATRIIDVDMSDRMRFAPGTLTVKQGETIRFRVKNSGQAMHEMVLGTMDELKKHADMMRKSAGMKHDEPYIVHVEPGKTATLTWQFTKAGEFHYGCLVPGHFEAGMIGKLNVVASTPAHKH